MLASLLSCATRAFSVDSTFCAHSLVARPHLSIRVCVSVCHSLLLVYLFHLQICESLSTLLTLANILHQIFVPLSSPSSTISLILCRCEKPTRIGTNCAISLIHIGVIFDPFSTSVKVHLVLVLPFLPLTYLCLDYPSFQTKCKW